MTRVLTASLTASVLAVGIWASIGATSAVETPPSDKPAAKKVAVDTKEAVQQNVPGDAITAIENAESFTLVSLDPEDPTPGDSRERFYDWAVLGKADVTDPAVRKRLVEALWKGVAESDGAIASCFEPRHGIRVSHKGTTVDFIVCFKCLTARVTDGKRRGTFLVTRSPQPAFDKALTDLKVPLAAKAAGK